MTWMGVNHNRLTFLWVYAYKLRFFIAGLFNSIGIHVSRTAVQSFTIPVTALTFTSILILLFVLFYVLLDHVHHSPSITCLSSSSLPPAVWPGRRELWPLFHPPSTGSHPSRPGGHHEPWPRRVRGLFLHKPRIPCHGSPELRATS